MSVTVLFEGYSKDEGRDCHANCSCVLIKGPPNVIIDTMTAWDSQKLLDALQNESITPDEIDFVVCTHGHSDHIGCNHLFQKAKHIVGYSVSYKEIYFDHDFRSGKEYVISDKVRVMPTPGHTMQCVSVIVDSPDGTIAVTGDLFEKFEDLENPWIWKAAGSDSEELQEVNRRKVLQIADVIIPGHGKAFEVPKKYKELTVEVPSVVRI